MQFASLVSADPMQTKAAYRLIAKPASVDVVSLGGLSQSPILERLMASGLLFSGNEQVPLRIAQYLYFHGRLDDAFELVRRTPGRAAQLLDGWLSLHRGEIDRAANIFRAATDRQATKQGAMTKLAICHYLKGELDQAVDTVLIGAALSPRYMPSMTLFSRIVRDKDDIHRYLSEKLRIARNGFTASSAAQFIRTCGRAGAIEEGEREAKGAVINLCQSQLKPNSSLDLNQETGLKKGSFSSEKGDLILKHISELASAAQVRLFLMGGTLLGLVRDKALLSWDKDLDFGCLSEEASLQDLWDLFSASPYFIPMGTVGDRLIKLRHLSGVTVDVFINFRDGGIRWHGGQFSFWRCRDFGLKSISIRNTNFFIPEDPDAYLESHYGTAWRVPDPDFDVFWEAPDSYSPNRTHRYLNTIAKGIQLLSAGSIEKIKIRLGRAEKASIDDVAAGFRYVMDVHRRYGHGADDSCYRHNYVLDRTNTQLTDQPSTARR